MNKSRKFLSLLALMLLITSCNLPAPQQGAATQAPGQDQNSTSSVPVSQGEATATATNTQVTAPVITDTVQPSATACSPVVVANSAVNVRACPGTFYDTVATGDRMPAVPAPPRDGWRR